MNQIIFKIIPLCHNMTVQQLCRESTGPAPMMMNSCAWSKARPHLTVRTTFTCCTYWTPPRPWCWCAGPTATTLCAGTIAYKMMASNRWLSSSVGEVTSPSTQDTAPPPSIQVAACTPPPLLTSHRLTLWLSRIWSGLSSMITNI